MKLKNTLVTIYFKSKRYTFMVPCQEVDGKTILDMNTYNKLLDKINVQRRQTFSIG